MQLLVFLWACLVSLGQGRRLKSQVASAVAFNPSDRGGAFPGGKIHPAAGRPAVLERGRAGPAYRTPILSAFSRTSRSRGDLRMQSTNPFVVAGRAFSQMQFRKARNRWNQVRNASEGEVLFCEESHHGNGKVRVRRNGPWRYITFDDSAGEQGLAYFEDDERPCPECMGLNYLCVMATAALGFMGLQSGPPSRKRHVLCIGLGAGSLPGFLSHHVPNLQVDVVEVDPVVVRACREQLACPFRVVDETSCGTGNAGSEGSAEDAHAPYTVFISDAIDYLLTRTSEICESDDGYSTILLDAFDGTNQIPEGLLTEEFLRNCRSLLAPEGVLVCNCLNSNTGSEERIKLDEVMRKFQDLVGPLYTFPVKGGVSDEANVVLASRRGTELPRPGRSDLSEAALKMCGGWYLGIAMEKIFSRMLWTELLPPRDEKSIVREAIHPLERVNLEKTMVELVPPNEALQREDGASAQWLRLSGMLNLDSSAPKTWNGCN